MSFSQALTGLAFGTTYYWCAIATNSVNTTVGAIESFTTLQPPSAFNLGYTSLSSTSATLSAESGSGGDTTTAWFEYGLTNPGTCNGTFGSSAPTTGGVALGSGTSYVTYSEPITGLSPGTTYYYCPLAQNPEGLGVGSVATFVTPTVPTATTTAATTVTATTATLNGTTNPAGATDTGYFRYSTTNPTTCNTTFGTLTPSGGIAAGSGYSAVALSQGITGLVPNTTYYFCAYAINTYGTALGSVFRSRRCRLPPRSRRLPQAP